MSYSVIFTEIIFYPERSNIMFITIVISFIIFILFCLNQIKIKMVKGQVENEY